MIPKFSDKATNEEIRSRFDKDVERFSNILTGQQTTLDATFAMELCAQVATSINPNACELLDIGCGAGNYTLKILEKNSSLNCTLNDLSTPMLNKANERVSAKTNGRVIVLNHDMRNLRLQDSSIDIIIAAAVFHHLRDDKDWEMMFAKLYKALKPGGSIWIADLVSHDSSIIEKIMDDRYGAYLEKLGGAEYRTKVMEYIAYEDTPRSLSYQLLLLRKVGFQTTEILHKNINFAAFGAIK
jgi:tRNA (cmo5U34)-methyltransferase